MKKIRTRRQISKTTFISLGFVISLDLLQPDHGPAAPGTDILNEADGGVLVWLFYQNAAEIRLENVIYRCKQIQNAVNIAIDLAGREESDWNKRIRVDCLLNRALDRFTQC